MCAIYEHDPNAVEEIILWRNRSTSIGFLGHILLFTSAKVQKIFDILAFFVKKSAFFFVNSEKSCNFARFFA
jgi:hypothetical protein